MAFILHVTREFHNFNTANCTIVNRAHHNMLVKYNPKYEPTSRDDIFTAMTESLPPPHTGKITKTDSLIHVKRAPPPQAYIWQRVNAQIME